MSERVGVLLMAYGTPAGRDDIERYYTDIRRGHPPTPEQLADLVRRYEAIGGLSPLAARTEAQRRALQHALDEDVPGRFEVVLGHKHSPPHIEASVETLSGRGARRIVALVLAPHYSPLSIGEYLARARRRADELSTPIAAIEHWHTLDRYVSFCAEAVAEQLDSVDSVGAVDGAHHTLFTAHSLPITGADGGAGYRQALHETASAVAARLALSADQWSIAFQSAGRTAQPWLGPTLGEAIDALADDGATATVVVCPCGFVADHLEVLYDLDIEARQHAAQRGIGFRRTKVLNDDPAVFAALAGRVIAAGAR